MKKLYFLVSIVLVLFDTKASAQNTNLTFRSKLAFPSNQLSNIWGYTAAGKEYALVGHRYGASVVDVTNPDMPALLFNIPGKTSIWREIRTWQNFAYITTEGGRGVTIADLSQLPDTITYTTWMGDSAFIADHGDSINTIHALHIDNGYLYLYGTQGKITPIGTIISDLADPLKPIVKSTYNQYYIHDGMVYHDTIWAGQIYEGNFAAIDVTDKTNPILLQTQETPNKFTHNTWLSDNHKVLFTTDETEDSYLATYDISNIDSIRFLGKVQSNPGSLCVVHNTYILNDYAVTAWYRDGAIIVDGHKPDNLVIVGSYDTSPMSGYGFNGAWGVYAYFPSGNILVSDMEEGMYVLTPTYKRACYLEGIVTDSITGLPINDAKVIIDQIANNSTKSILDGNYKTGTPTSGIHTITASKAGYYTKNIANINLQTATVTALNIQLVKDPNGINEIQDRSVVRLSPNPASDNLKIENCKNFESFSINDVIGKPVISGKIAAGSTSTSINVSQLPKGLYFISLYNTENSAAAKVLKFTKE